MKNITIIFQIILIISCGIPNPKNTANNSIVTEDVSIGPKPHEIEASRYYYSRHFDSMVQHSLQNGFHLDDQFEGEDSYVIVKAAYTLALSGDSIVKQKLFEFIKKLASSEKEFIVDESINVLIEFSTKLYGKELFVVGIEFLNPKHLMNVDSNSDEGGGDYNSSVFNKLKKLMTKEDRDFYYSKYSALFKKALEKNDKQAATIVWNEFYPYLIEELRSDKIDFITK